MMFSKNKQYILEMVIKLRAKSFIKVFIATLALSVFKVSVTLAQRDIIVTQADEEIRCRILDETPTRFIYAYIGPKGKVLRNEIFKNLVKNFNYNQYDSDLVATSFSKNAKKAKRRAGSKTSVNDSPKLVSKSQAKKAQKLAEEEARNSVKKEDNGAQSDSQETEKDSVETVKGSVNLNDVGSKKAEKKEKSIVQVEVLNEGKSKTETVTTEKDIALERPIVKEKKVETSKEPESTKKEKTKVDIPSVKETEIIDKELAQQSAPIKEIKKANKEVNVSDLPPVAVKSDSVLIDVIPLPSAPKNTVGLPEVAESFEPLEIESEKATLTPSSITLPPENTPIPDVTINTNSEYKNYLKWRIGAKAGIGNIRDNSFVASNAYGLYQEKLLKGWTFGADIAFFPMESFGLGVVYTDFVSSNSATNINYVNQMTEVDATGSISDKISRKFVGPAMFLRKSIDYKTFIVLSVSPGMYFYSDKGDYDGANFDYRGKQFGGAATLGLDFLLGNDIIGRDIILSLEAGYNNGKLAEIDFGDGSGNLLLTKPYIMDRLDFSIGLRFLRFPKYLKSK
jgi:hypothetical protein